MLCCCRDSTGYRLRRIAEAARQETHARTCVPLTERCIHVNKTYINLTQPSFAGQLGLKMLTPARQFKFHRIDMERDLRYKREKESNDSVAQLL